MTNFGTIVAGGNGIGVYLHSGDVSNSGTIIALGSLGQAVYVQNGKFINSGLLVGAVAGIGLALGSGPSGAGSVTVSGTVIGAIGISVAPASTVSQTVSVSGLVTGTSGTAVSLTKGGSDRLIVEPGAAFTGIVNGGGGKSVVEVAASPGGGGAAGAEDGSATTVYVNLGSVTNFSALQVDPSAAMDAGGSLSFDTLVNEGRINLAAVTGGGHGRRRRQSRDDRPEERQQHPLHRRGFRQSDGAVPAAGRHRGDRPPRTVCRCDDRIRGRRPDRPAIGPGNLCSRSGVPSLVGITAHDHRWLGVAVAGVELRQPGLAMVFQHDAPLFSEGGCYRPENGYAWTDGELALPEHLFAHLDGAFTLIVQIERPGMRYPVSPAIAAAA